MAVRAIAAKMASIIQGWSQSQVVSWSTELVVIKVLWRRCGLERGIILRCSQRFGLVARRECQLGSADAGVCTQAELVSPQVERVRARCYGGIGTWRRACDWISVKPRLFQG